MEGDVGSATPVNFMPNGGFDQNSAGDSLTSGSSSPLKSDEKVQSRYLSPHMASCHDFCKYGKKHDSEAETRRLNFRKLLKKKVVREEQNQVTILVPGERRTRTVTKTKDISKVETKFPANTEVPKAQTLLTMKNSIASGEKKTLHTTLENEQGRGKSLNPGDGKKLKMTKGGTPTPPLQSKPSPYRPDVNKLEDLSPASDMDTSEEPNIMKASIASGEKKTLQTTLENEQGRAKGLNPGDGKKVNMIKGGTSPRPSSLQPKASPKRPNGNKFEDLSPASDMDTSEEPDIIKKNTESSVKKPISPVVHKVVQQKALPSISEPAKIKQKVTLPSKRVDGAGKPAITLKTKTPLIRSLSKLKSLRSQIARRNQENDIIRRLGTSKNAGRELSKPSTTSFSSKSSRNLVARRNQDEEIAKSLTTSKLCERKILKPTQASFSSKTPHDNALSLQPRKLRSMRKTSMTIDSVSSLQPRKLRSIKGNPTPDNSVSSLLPRKLRSIKENSTPHDSVPSLQPRKLRSFKRNSTPHDSISSLQPTKLRSIKRTSAPQESVSSLNPRKLWNVNQSSKPHGSISSLQPRKLRSLKRSFSVKDKDNVRKAYTESKSGNNDLDSNPKIEESKPAISEVSDEEIESRDEVEVSKDGENKRPRRTATTTGPARPEDHTSKPFKLKFRRGKVINLRSDSIGARRLWFNLGIGRLASDNLNGNGLPGKRSFRKKRGDGSSFDSRDPDSEVHSVVLKHQDVTEKKDAKSLFNHVIEETANKLVETRKSKVKALVGAFESVISLQ